MNTRESQYLGAGIMLGAVAGAVIAAAVVGWQDPTPDARHTVKLNGREIQVIGHWSKDARGRDELVWNRRDQDWLNGAPVMQCPNVARSAKSRYTIGVNGSAAEVTGWTDSRGEFHWCYDDQRWESAKPTKAPLSEPQSEPPIRTPGLVGADGAINYGIKIEALGGHDVQIRASDPEIQAEVEAALDDCKPPAPKLPDLPEIPGSALAKLWLWLHGFGDVKDLIAYGFAAALTVVAVTLFVRQEGNGSPRS